jgi:hypothetical protein
MIEAGAQEMIPVEDLRRVATDPAFVKELIAN